MRVQTEVVLRGIEGKNGGEFEGRKFKSSSTFHLEVDLVKRGENVTFGIVTRPFRLGEIEEARKWEHLANSLPVKCVAVFELGAAREDGTSMQLVELRPAEREVKKAA